MAEENLLQTVYKDKYMLWLVRISGTLLLFLLLYTIFVIITGRPFKMWEWNQQKQGNTAEVTPKQRIQMRDGIGNLRVDSGTYANTTQGNNSPINTTSGGESSIMLGKGDYKPNKSVSNSPINKINNTINTKDSSHSHAVFGNMIGGVNGDINTIKIPQRHIQAADLYMMTKFFKNKDQKVDIYLANQDAETTNYANEIKHDLMQLGYKRVEISLGFYNDISSLPEQSADTANGKQHIILKSQSNVQ